MKKFTSKILLLVMVLAMSFGLAACGSDDDKKTETATSGTNEGSGTSADSSGSSSFDTIEDYLNSEDVKSALKTMEDALANSGMNLKVSADGNRMIYTYTYDKFEKSDDLVKSLETAMEAQDGTFQSTADQIKQQVNVDSATVVIEYVDSKGEMIYTKEYTSK